MILTKEVDNFCQNFKIGEYYCIVLQDEDQKPLLKINNRDFNDIMKDERTGKLEKERDKYAKNKKNDFKRINGTSESDYYKRALKYNGENYVEGTDGEIYDIEEQRRRLEEFEKKKEKENEEKNKRNKNNINNNEDKYDNNKGRKYLKFVLDNETVRKNQTIIQNINNIFDDDNLLDLNDIDFTQTNTNKGNYMGENSFNNNNNYNYGQMNNNNNMNNNMNNNEINQNVFNQYLSNIEGNNNDFNQGFNNNNNNYNNPNNFNNQNNNNNYNDDFNPFDD